jgi:Zn finger protein HypA/HybF involved in hydrogenase expression
MGSYMDGEVTALNKFACPACGAQAVWTPAKHALVCPYCSTESPAELEKDGQLVEELDLVASLRNIPADQRGWVAERKTVKCQSCQAISVFDSQRVAQNCDFCGAPALIPVDDIKAPIRPGSQLPFKISESQVRESIRQWYGSHFWARQNLGEKAMTDTLHGVYVPFWTFDAQGYARWEAEAGYHYYTKDSQGRNVQRTRWEYASGEVQLPFDDLLVPGSRGIHSGLLAEIGPFPTTRDLLPYDPGYLSGWVVEQYQIDLIEAAQASRERMLAELESLCASQVPGDTYRGLRVQPQFTGQTFKHTLLPVWLLSYTYGSRIYQVTVNGATGKIAGEYPLSWIKITIAILLALLLFYLILFMQATN